jgi:hypothetical protein
MENGFYVFRTCKKCKNIDKFSISKRELAFQLFNEKEIWNTPCSKCSSEKCESVGFNNVEIDDELWKEWSTNDELNFFDQDEDVIIAEEKYLPIIVSLIDKPDISNWKKITLLSALCIVYHSQFSAKQYNVELIEKLEKELMLRKTVIFESEHYIEPTLFEFIRSKIL